MSEIEEGRLAKRFEAKGLKSRSHISATLSREDSYIRWRVKASEALSQGITGAGLGTFIDLIFFNQSKVSSPPSRITTLTNLSEDTPAEVSLPTADP